MSLETLLGQTSELSPEETAIISKAYWFAEEAHRPQLRKSGEPYFVHVEAVAVILAEMGMDAATIAAGLLHDVVEDTHYTTDDIQREFGHEIANLVDGVTKMDTISPDNPAQELTEAEYLRKTIYAMNNDVRVILIKIADRLHNMRTLGVMRPIRRVEISEETLELFAPLATRLGMWKAKGELEDLCFQYLDPDAYQNMVSRVKEYDERNMPFFEQVVHVIRTTLRQYGISATIQRHPRYYYSIYREMQIKQIGFEDTFGVRAVRIIVDTTMQCYQALGAVHEIWRPIPGRVQDFIASPKDNFYQSLHTAVFREDGGSLELQIRTWDMDSQSKYGIASYWRLKKKDAEKFQKQLNRRLSYIHSLIEPAELETSPERFLKQVIENIDSDRIYVHTPRGDTLDLPRGSTPIDFAYHIHTEVGHHTRGAQVNGKLVSLDYRLASGDTVEIITIPRGGPHMKWLDKGLGYVHTNRAYNKIRDWFRKQGREQLIRAARQTLDDKLEQMGMEAGVYDVVIAHTPYQTLEDLLIDIGIGTVSATEIVTQTLDSLGTIELQAVEFPNLPMTGASGYNVKLARCCHPLPGDDIIGYITRDAQISIHRADCPVLASRGNIADRLIPVGWGRRLKDKVFPVPVELRTLDRAGILGEIGNLVANENVNMSSVHINTNNGIATFSLTMEIDSYNTLSRVLTKIESLEGVLEAHRRATN